jgi:hypothetical protein
MLAHSLISIAMVFGFSFVIIGGTLNVMHDLFDRTLYPTPLMPDDRLDEGKLSTEETASNAENQQITQSCS